MAKKTTMKDYLKKASGFNSALTGISLAWFIYSIYELVTMINDAKDGVLEKFYNLTPMLGLNKGSLSLMLAGLFVLLSFIVTVTLLVKGIRADKGILIGKGLYILIILSTLVSLLYFTNIIPGLLKGALNFNLSLKSIIISLLLLVALVLAILVLINLSKSTALPIFNTYRDEEFEEEYEDEEIIDDREERYAQDRNQFEAVAKDHSSLNDSSTRNLSDDDNLMNTQYYSQGTENQDTIVINQDSIRQKIKEDDKQMEEILSSKDSNIGYQRIVREENKETVEPEVIRLDDDIEMVPLSASEKVSASSEAPTVIDAPIVSESTPEDVTVMDETPTEAVKEREEEPVAIAAETVKETENSPIESDIIEETSTRTTKKVIAMPGDDSKVIVVTRVFENEILVSETSEIKNKTDLKK